MTTPAILTAAFAWWVAGLIIVSTFLLLIRRDESAALYDAMGKRRLRTLRALVTEAWIWPVYLAGIGALFFIRSRGRS